MCIYVCACVPKSSELGIASVTSNLFFVSFYYNNSHNNTNKLKINIADLKIKCIYILSPIYCWMRLQNICIQIVGVYKKQ